MIPNDKILVVSGEARSGTSAMMQSLNLAGVPTHGDKWPQEVKFNEQLKQIDSDIIALQHNELAILELNKRKSVLLERWNKFRDRMLTMNPGGFYEDGKIVTRGINEIGDSGGKAVKIISKGIVRSNTSLVYKIILCLRNPKYVGESQRDLVGNVEVVGEEWENFRGNPNPIRFIRFNGGLANFILGGGIPIVNWLVIDYDEIVDNPMRELQRVFNFIEYKPTTEQFDLAVANYSGRLRRSNQNFTDWADKIKLEGETADIIYNGLKEFTTQSLEVVKLARDNYLENNKLEQVRWYEPSVGWLINADIARKLLIDNVFLTKLRNVANTSLRTGWHPQVCEGYEISPEVYIIHRPADLGDLTVNYVNCNGKILTREQAFSIHQISKISKTSPPVNQIKLSQWNWSW